MNDPKIDTILTESVAEALLSSSCNFFKSLVVFESCSSTMNECSRLMDLDEESDETFELCHEEITPIGKLIVVSKQQSAGRGREGRRWESKMNMGVWVTFGFELTKLTNLDGLSLAIGIGICSALRELGAAVQLKWPNDLVILGGEGQPLRKLGGILIETTLRENGAMKIRVGVGVNLETPEDVINPSIGLRELVDRDITYREALVLIANSVGLVWEQFLQGGFADFKELWDVYSMMNGRQLSYALDGRTINGMVIGIDDSGALIVDTSEGQTIKIRSGEVKLLDATSY